MTSILLRFASQWIAGERAEEGIKRAKEANSKGILGLLNLLGEHVENKEEIERTISEYEKLLSMIEQGNVSSQISIKPTQMGVNVDFDYCVQNYLRVANSCKVHSDNWLWIDMENAPYTQRTIDLYAKVLKHYQNTGIAIQAYMRRSEEDLRYLLPLGAKVRLVKGAYNEDESIVFKKKQEINSNYARLLEILFAQKERNFFAVATHDSNLIALSKELSKKYNSSNFEYEMLMGVRDSLKMELVSQSLQVREYIPYGPQWLPYAIRRLREKKSNILLLGRSIFSR